jgi:hypothetical protein
MGGGPMKSEKAIQNECLVEVTGLPDVMAWRENSGLAWIGKEYKARIGAMVHVTADMKILTNARPLRAGVPGIADIMGVAQGSGFALEVKDEEGRQEPSQVLFQRAFERAGGVYGIVRSKDEAVAFLRRTVLS